MKLEIAKEIIRRESEAVSQLADKLNSEFEKAVDLIFNCEGRVIITGMGKSGIIGRKVTATFNSTGTPAVFMHPSEAIHGDLGIVRKEDVVLIISKSGDTDEIFELLVPFKRMGVPIISIVGNIDSQLAKSSECVLDTSVDQEAESYNLIPTCSTTAALVIGDALAIVLLKMRDFSPEDFARLHPGGALGRKLLLRVEDLMHTGEEIPAVKLDSSMQETILEMTSKRLGTTLILDQKGKLAGIFTDGDLRRIVEKNEDFMKRTARDVMIASPKTVKKDEMAEKALNMMESFKITSLPVIDSENTPIGILHIHDILTRKIV
jgi:arabinose-5-phosphate isomerase